MPGCVRGGNIFVPQEQTVFPVRGGGEVGRGGGVARGSGQGCTRPPGSGAGRGIMRSPEGSRPVDSLWPLDLSVFAPLVLARGFVPLEGFKCPKCPGKLPV